MRTNALSFMTAGLLVMGAAAWAGGPLGDTVPPGLGDERPSTDGGPLDNELRKETVETCRQDISGNGTIDFPDLLAVLEGWGTCLTQKAASDTLDGDRQVVRRACEADVDRSGEVDFLDLLAVMSTMGLDCGDLDSTP